MKVFIWMIAVLSALAGVLYFLNHGSQKDEDNCDAKDTQKNNEYPARAFSYEKTQEYTRKQRTLKDIRERHHKAGKYIENSLTEIKKNSDNEKAINKVMGELKDL